MKKLLDIFILSLVIALLIIVFNCSTVHGGRGGRIFDNPQSVFPAATLKPNKAGGYDYYMKGKKIGYSTKNTAGSYNIYHMNRLKWVGSSFAGTSTYRDAQPSVTRASSYAARNKIRAAQIRKKKSEWVGGNKRSTSKHYTKPTRNLYNYDELQAYNKVTDTKRAAFTAKYKANAAKTQTSIWDHFYPGNK